MSLLAPHLAWLEQIDTYTSACGLPIPVFALNHDALDEKVMSTWASHFRNHYCRDDQLNFLKNPMLTNSEYLLAEKFPHQTIPPGPSVRAGDFAEILIADYLQYVRNYQIPRTRYDRKGGTNESTRGSDVIAFKKLQGIVSDNDELLVFEIKAKASENSKSNVLQNAIDHSIKDELRIAESLSTMKQKLFDRNDVEGVLLIDRFQREPDYPCKRRYGAAAVYTTSALQKEIISNSTSTDHPNAEKLELLVVSANHLMSLIHALYQRAADEA